MSLEPECSVSIIIPVYKSERFLRKCIDSVLGQTLQGFELILVDDGSPDSSGFICDCYAKSDSRVKVIHRPHGGSGAGGARNSGISVARGKYVGFVDSDDWVSPYLFETLYRLCEVNSSDISMCSFIMSSAKNPSPPTDVCIYTKDQFMPLLLIDAITSHCFNKLFAVHLWDDVRFPDGIVEDMPTMVEIFSKAHRLAVTKERLYFYDSTRPDNVSNDPGRLIENTYKRGEAFRVRHEIAKLEYPQVESRILRKAVRSFASAFGLFAQQNEFEQKSVILGFFAQNRHDIFSWRNFDFLAIISVALITSFPQVYLQIYRIVRGRFGRKFHDILRCARQGMSRRLKGVRLLIHR